MNTPTPYSMEFKAEALWMLRETPLSGPKVAESLGMATTSNLYNWRGLVNDGGLTLPAVPPERQQFLRKVAAGDATYAPAGAVPTSEPDDQVGDTEEAALPAVIEPIHPFEIEATETTGEPPTVHVQLVQEVEALRAAEERARDAEVALYEARSDHLHELAERDALITDLRKQTATLAAELESVLAARDLYRQVATMEMAGVST